MIKHLDLFPDLTTVNENGRISIAGHDLGMLARQYGTPLYLYGGATITSQHQLLMHLLNRHYPGSHQITYAAKAYFSLGLAQRFAGIGLGVDVVSQGEMEIARLAGFIPSRVHLHGNNKSETELRTAIQWDVQSIVIDSLEELEFLESVAASIKKPVRIWLRITPGISVDTHHYTQTAHPASKFGLPIQDGQAATAIRKAMHSRFLKLTGLHTHLGSQFFEPDPYHQAISMLIELAAECDFLPEELSPGGGWGVPYNPNQKAGDPEIWIKTVSSTLVEACDKHNWILPRLVVEPGRWMVARAGVALYTVGTTKKTSNGTFMAAIDGGMADNPRPALYQTLYSAYLAEKATQPVSQKTTIVGKFCESGDILIPEVDLPQVARGDILVIPVAGAYQLSMSSNYNLASRPVVLWLDDKVEILQRRENPQDKGWWLGE